MAFQEPALFATSGSRVPAGKAIARSSSAIARDDSRDGAHHHGGATQGPERPTIRAVQAVTDGDDQPAVSGAAGRNDDTERPIVNLADDRVRVLIEDSPALFEIEENTDADPNYGAWRAIHALGANAVRRHEATIDREAEAQGVDADLVKAILYVERAQGYHDVIHEALGQSSSLPPMNIRPDPWAALEQPPADLTDPETNIRIAVTLIRRISERIENPTPAKVASIWIFTGRESVNDYGQRVQEVYRNRRWEDPIPRRGQMRRSVGR